jgi:hypothetical protein
MYFVARFNTPDPGSLSASMRGRSYRTLGSYPPSNRSSWITARQLGGWAGPVDPRGQGRVERTSSGQQIQKHEDVKLRASVVPIEVTFDSRSRGAPGHVSDQRQDVVAIDEQVAVYVAR